MSKHTPAPWKVCGGMTPHFKTITSPQGYIVFSMADHYRHTEHGKTIKAPDYDTQKANARLIAAAPELLEALGAILASYDSGTRSVHTGIFEAIYPKALRAIKKATQGE